MSLISKLWPRECSNGTLEAAPPHMPNHPKLGQPKNIWIYQDEAGQNIAANCRFDDIKGKTYRPYDILNNKWAAPPQPHALFMA